MIKRGFINNNHIFLFQREIAILQHKNAIHTALKKLCLKLS